MTRDYDPELVSRAIESMRSLNSAFDKNIPAEECKKLLDDVESTVILAIGKTKNTKLNDSLRRALEKYQSSYSLWSRMSGLSRDIKETERMSEGYLRIYKRYPSDRVSDKLDEFIEKQKQLEKEYADLQRQYKDTLSQARTEVAIIESINN
jgi:hypothetical protein